MKKDFNTFLPKLVKLELFKDFNIKNENDKRILSLVYERFSLKSFHAGDIILKEGDKGHLFYILLSGKVQVSRKTPSGDSIALAIMKAEQNIFFGEASLVEQDIQSATIKTLTDCTTLTISGKDFVELCNREPLLGFRVFYNLSKKMKSAIKKANSDITTLYEALFKEIEGDY